ncbi:uncharacterized protein nompA isoform X6 [Plodia interpunctella]|uniref:uncharacterized protein nompA isoform X6 n=1 Tax=Plodia interpunctella TaxID=58824 RepID=UPI002367ED66|nr:uncharacterized protein LOC128677803 isoform X5 [Plodia interpunctella]
MKPRGASVMHAFTALTMLTMANAQTTCNQGMGRVMYERLPNQQLHGFDDDVVRETAPPFRVLEKCQDLCLRDRSVNSLVRTCNSIDFQPGARIAAFSPEPEYEESTCFLTREQAMPEGIGSLMIVPNSVHFNEICLTSNRPERECPSRRYVFERHARKRLKLPPSDLKEIMVANRTECEDKCLQEFSFVCRSATYDSALRTCSLSRFTRRTHPELLEDDHNADYLENTCLNAERRCDGLAVFIKEENKRLGGPFEADVFSNMTLEECQSMCVRAEKYFCRSIEHDTMTKQCVLSEEDSVSQKDDVTVSASPTHHFYDLVCLDNLSHRAARGTEYPDNSVTSHLFSPGRRPDTAFQRYRNSRITGEFHSEITGRSLSECLDECLRQTSFQCRSAVYSDRARTCRLSRYNQKDGMRLLYDPDFDYYENLMHQMVSGEGEAGAGSGSQDRPWARPTTTGYGRGGYYGSDYPPSDRYPVPDRGIRPTPDRFPAEPRPSFGIRRPIERPGGYRGSYPPAGGLGGGYGGYDQDGPIGPGAPVGGPIGPVGVPIGPLGAPIGGPLGGPLGGPVGRPPVGHRPWQGSRCEEDSFRQVGRQRMQRRFVRRFTTALSLAHCQRECIEARDFICRSFNFRESPYGGEPRDNCELSDRDTRELDAANPAHFDNTANDYDFYERALGRIADDCLDVSQVCNEDGMEFTLRLPEGFYGRMYTYGFYDRCFFRGNGGVNNVLRITGAHGYPECGTQRYGDTMTNIVVVQFSDNVQTSRDKRFNLTCLFRGPAEAVVTSNYIGAGLGFDSIDRSGSPIPIEYLPEESSLNSKVRLMILYQGRPTTTIAVGDPLTFRLEAQDGYNYATDIFATNVIARDPYSGRSVQLIDRVGCPVDPDVFPELDKGRNGDSLEARFNAFKIPESNFLVFEATVRTCRDGCQPAYCPSHTGRSEPSFGRRRRDVNSTAPAETNTTVEVQTNDSNKTDKAGDKDDGAVYKVSYETADVDKYLKEEVETPSHVRKMIEVFDNRNELIEENGPADSAPVVAAAGVCVSPYHYRALLVALCVLLSLLLAMLTAALYIYKRYWRVLRKNIQASSPAPALRPVTPGPRPTRPSLFSASHLHKPFSLSGLGRTFAEVGEEAGSAGRLANAFDDGSEPIYTDPSLFERSRSLRSLHSLDMKPERRDHRS